MIEVRDSELGDFQRAARTLLVHGLVTERRPNDREFRNVRRYAEPLDSALREIAGYSVLVTRTAVRLVRALDQLIEAVVFTTPSRRAFDRPRYALVVLALAALERSASQTTLTDLARRIRRSADRTSGLAFDPDDHSSRLALGHAVRALEEIGALTLTDGSREAWEQGHDEGEALYDIDRAMCRQVFALPRGLRREAQSVFLHQEASNVGRDAERRARRQRLARLLLEMPVVYLNDLDEADQRFLRTEAKPLLTRLETLTGARGERRSEGLALIDPGRSFSSSSFPRGGSAHQAALLLATRLCALHDQLRTEPAPHVTEASDQLLSALRRAAPEGVHDIGPPVRERSAYPFVGDDALLAEATRLRDEIGQTLKADYRDDEEAFLRDAVEVLTRFDLARPVEGGLLLMPALWRFREVQVEAEPEVKNQLGLFGGGA
ncbi:MAG: TIGR02678 family protein [Deltaproteobacteria bacterium]|nr:MAG: TIGR02678 family protein [Deltaproteobacteria bacterium]